MFKSGNRELITFATQIYIFYKTYAIKYFEFGIVVRHKVLFYFKGLSCTKARQPQRLALKGGRHKVGISIQASAGLILPHQHPKI